MLDLVLSFPHPLLSTIVFIITLSVRRLVFHRLVGASIYYIILLMISAFFTIALISVQRELHFHLQDFIHLEQNNQLTEARNDPNPDNPIFQMDLRNFENADEFRKYIEERDITAEKALCMSIALFAAILVDISIITISRIQRRLS
jgi:hypothetical protein